jgi:peptidoglycan/LPS O-acetylase OafA/YrhL
MTGPTELGTAAGAASGGRTVAWGVAAAADAAAVVAFVLIGRRSHAESDTLTGFLHTAWPFLVGALIGWLAVRGWRAPASIGPTGVSVWIACVAGGMVLRAVSGQGVAVSFVVVASIVLAIFVVGWRVATGLAVRRQAGRT